MTPERKLAEEFSQSLRFTLDPDEIDRLERLLKSIKHPHQQHIDFSQYEHPTARSADPVSSHAAVDRSATKQQRQIVLNEVLKRPGRTARELAGEAGLDYEMVHKRLPELRTEEKICNSRWAPAWAPRSLKTYRHCSVTGRKAMEWWPVSTEEPTP